jgi:hypothetical protein
MKEPISPRKSPVKTDSIQKESHEGEIILTPKQNLDQINN